MKKSLVILLISIVICSSYGQSNTDSDTMVIVNKGLSRYFVLDSIKIETYIKNTKNNSFIFINGKAIDSTGIRCNESPTYFQDRIFFNNSENKNELKICYHVTGKTENYNLIFYTDNGYGQLYSIDDKKIFLINPINDIKTLFYDFNETIEKQVNEDIDFDSETIENVFFINSSQAIVEICYYGNFESCTKHSYYLISPNRKDTITNRIEIPYSKDIYQNQFVYIEFISQERDFIRFKNFLLGNKSKDNKIESRLLDSQCSFKSDVLNLTDYTFDIKGVNIQNGTIKEYYINSKLNNGTFVIVPFKFLPSLDIALYNAFNNNTIAKEDLEKFGKYELDILRNLIFAKHNYDFSSDFYQAYFNLYSFYNTPEMLGSRTKDVNDKLTEADKTNLKLIKEMEEK